MRQNKKDNRQPLPGRYHAQGLPWNPMYVIGFLALFSVHIVGPELARSHSEVEPEIAEVSAELVDDPDNVDLLLLRGQLYRFNRKFQESLEDLDQAWVLDRQNQKVALERSRALVALRRDREAEAALNLYLQGVSGDSRVMALVERAALYARTGQVDLALADYAETLQRFPTVELYLARGRLQETLGRFADAEAGYLAGQTRFPHARIFRKQLIRVHTAQGHYREALNLINQELTAAVVKTDWYVRRAEVLTAMGEADASHDALTNALTEATRALTKRPTALHRLARAKIYRALGQVDEAKEDLRVAVEVAPRFQDARTLLNHLEAR